VLPLISKVLLTHGMMDLLLPNPMTTIPVLRVIDHYLQKESRGWAWFFMLCGLVKAHCAFSQAHVAAHSAGWVYFAQGLAMAFEGFLADKPPRFTKHMALFCAGMWAWLQIAALPRAQRLLPQIRWPDAKQVINNTVVPRPKSPNNVMPSNDTRLPSNVATHHVPSAPPQGR